MIKVHLSPTIKTESTIKSKRKKGRVKQRQREKKEENEKTKTKLANYIGMRALES